MSAVSTYLSTASVACASDPVKAMNFIKIYNKCAKEVKSDPSTIWYNPFDWGEEATTSSFMKELAIFSFADAGFDSLEGNRSTQACVIVLGKAKGK